MSQEHESEILTATWDRPQELFVRQENFQESLSTETLELPTPIESSLETLRRNRKTTQDIDQTYDAYATTWPTTHYLLHDKLYEASLDEASQQTALDAVYNTVDPEIQCLLLNELGLQSMSSQAWTGEESKLVTESLRDHGVALLPNTLIADQPLKLLMMGENGRDVLQVEVPSTSFSSDQTKDEQIMDELSSSEKMFTPLDKIKIEDTLSTVGIKYELKMQLVRTETGFQFYIDGKPHPGIRHDDPRIQLAIDQLLRTGLATDSIEENGFLTDLEYSCIGDPSSLEIGQSIEVILHSQSNPIEVKLSEVSDDELEVSSLEEISTEINNPNIAEIDDWNLKNNNDGDDFSDWLFADNELLIDEPLEQSSSSPLTNAICDAKERQEQLVSQPIQKTPTVSLKVDIIQPQKIIVLTEHSVQNLQPVDKTTFSIPQSIEMLDQTDIRQPNHINQFTAIHESQLPIAPDKLESQLPDKLSPVMNLDWEKTFDSAILAPSTTQATNSFSLIIEPINKQESRILSSLETKIQNVTQIIQQSKPQKPRDPDVFVLPIPVQSENQATPSTQKVHNAHEVGSSRTAIISSSEKVVVIQNKQSKTKELQTKQITNEQEKQSKTTINKKVAGRKIETQSIQTSQVSPAASATDHERKMATGHDKATTINRRTITSDSQHQYVSVATKAKLHSNIRSHASTMIKSSHQKYQAAMLPTGSNESARSVLVTVIERFNMRTNLEHRPAQITLQDINDAHILREQIYPLGLLCEEIVQIIQKFPSAEMQVGITNQAVTFIPDVPNPIDRATIARQIIDLPFSLESQNPLAFAYSLGTNS
jgi:hypothetical protein